MCSQLEYAHNMLTFIITTTSCGHDMPAHLQCPQDAFFEKHGVKLGFMSAFVKASGYALQEVPAVNGGGCELRVWVRVCSGRW